MAAQVQIAVGHVVAVQEQRFRLTTADGKSLLLTLATHANVFAGDLARFRDERIAVRVEYTGAPGLASGSACRITAI